MVASVIAGASSLVMISYEGLFLNESAGVSSWRPRMLPVPFALNALGAGGALSAGLMGHSPVILSVGTMAALAGSAAAGQAYLQKLRDSDKAARLSEHELTKGDQRNLFWLGAGVLGTLVPFGIAATSLMGVTGPKRLAFAGVCASVGALALRKAVLQAGIHAPITEPVAKEN